MLNKKDWSLTEPGRQTASSPKMRQDVEVPDPHAMPQGMGYGAT